MPIYHDDGGGNVSAPKPVAQPTVAKQTAKPVYYFRGQAFTSVAARNRAKDLYRARRRQASLMAKRRRDLLAARRRRRAQQILAARRRRAFQELTEKNKAAMGELGRTVAKKKRAAVDMAGNQKIRDEKAGAIAMKMRDERVSRDPRLAKMGETATEGDMRRADILKKLAKDRDYASILKAIRARQKSTGGRYLDRKLYDAVTADFQTHQQQVAKQVAKAQDTLEDLVAKAGFKRDEKGAWAATEDYDEAKLSDALEFMRSKEYRDLLAQYAKIFGSGRTLGQGQAISALALDISRANDEYYQRSIYGLNDASTVRQVQAARARMADEMKVGRVVTQMDERGDRRGPVTQQMTMRQYLTTLEDREKRRMVTARQAFTTRQRMMAQEGFEYDRRTGQFVDATQARDVTPTLNRALGPDREKILEALSSGNAVDRQRTLQDVRRRAMEQRAIELRQLLGLPVARNLKEAQALQASPKGRSFQRLMDAFEEQLSLTLTGASAPRGLEKTLGQAMEAPVLGELLKGIAIPVSAITGGLRWLQSGTGSGAQTNIQYDANGNIKTDNAKGGRIVTPDLSLEQLWSNLTTPGGTGKSALSLNPNTREQELRNELGAKADFADVIQDPNSDLGKMFEALITYGMEPFQGNTGNFAAQALLDPTIALNITKFLGAGRLATARAGGLRGALLSPAPTLRDFAGFALPKSMGGFGRHAFTTAETLRDLGNLVGRDIRHAASLTVDDVTTALRDLVEHPRTVKEATNFIERQFKVTPINAQQILESVQDYAVKKGSNLGLRVADSRTVEAALTQAERHGPVILSKAERALADIARERGAEVATQAVVKARALKAGTPVPARPKTKHTRQLTSARAKYENLVKARKTFSTEAQASAKLLRESVDADARRAAYDRLMTNLGELDRMDAQIYLDPSTPGRMRSVVERAEDNYARQLSRSGSPTTPSVAAATNAELVRDIHSVRMRLGHARRRLATMAPGHAKSRLVREIRDLELADRTLGEFRERNRGQGLIARDVVKQGVDDAEEYIRRPRLVAKAETKEAVQEEGARDLYTSFRGSDVETFDATPYDFTAADAAVSNMSGRTPTFRPVDDLDEAMDGLDLWESITVLDLVVSGGNRYYQAALDHLWLQAERYLPAGWKPQQMMDHAYVSHYRGSGVSLSQFEAADTAIVKARNDKGVGTAKGQGRLAGQQKLPAGVNLGRADFGLTETIAKVEALRGSPISPWAYDELRPTLRSTMLKMNASENMRKRALLRAKSTGETFDEAYEALWLVRRRQEASAQLEKYAMQPKFEGWLPDEILAVLNEEQLSRDLADNKPKVTEFQADSLRRSIAEITETSPHFVDDAGYMGRVFGGRLEELPPGWRLATPEENLGVLGPVPFFVAPVGDAIWMGKSARARFIQDWGIVIREDQLANPQVVTQLHEFGHALIEQSRYTDLAGFTRVDDLAADLYGGVIDPAWFPTPLPNHRELAAELYATYMGRGMNLDFISHTGRHIRQPSWADIRARLAPADQVRLDLLAAHMSALPLPTKGDFGLKGLNVPPLHSRQAAYDWLVDNGYWAKRTADTVRSGGRVWSIDAEREFFQVRFGFSPPWTDPDIIKAALDDPRSYQDLMESFGFLDNGFELHAAAMNLDSEGRANAMAFGTHETGGIKRARTRDELRDWFEKRYGSLVSDGKGNFHAIPWLMDAGSAEYKDWTSRVLREGKIINPTLIQPHQMDAFVKAYHKAIDRRLERMTRDGRAPVGEAWLPQEQMKFAIDVTNELLLTREWRSLFEKAPHGRRILGVVGQLQRLLVVAQLAFPVMNLIDRFTVKQVLLMVGGNGYRFWQHVDQDAMETLSDLRAINIRERGLWDMRTAGGWTRMRDSDLAKRTRAIGFAEGVRDLGYEISSWGEDSLKLNFAQRVYMSIRDDLIKGGIDPDQARVLALSQVRRKVKRFFPSLEDASDLERGLNQLVPFLSYNARNAVLGISIVVGHPYLWNLQNNIGALIEDSNRRDWDLKNPGVPLPDKYARRILLRNGGETYALDLAGFSDWFRGPERFSSDGKAPQTIGDNIKAWFRVPHPIQSAFVAWLEGGETPWGSQATISSFAPLADFLPGIFGPGESSGLDATQFLLRQLFFQTVAKVTPTEARAAAYFDLMNQGHTTQARRLLAMYPDVEMWLQSRVDPTRFRHRTTWDPSWFRGRPREQVKAFEEAKAGLDQIRNAFDAKLAEFYDKPWSDEWRDLKQQRRAAILQWMLTHPELIDARTMSMTWDQWLEQDGDWAVDDLVDSFLAEDTRRKKALEGLEDVAWLKAKREYLDWRSAYLGANPAVDDALGQTRTDLEKAWREHNEQWDTIVRRQIDTQIAVAELAKQEGGGDQALKEILYHLIGRDYAELDAEAFTQLYEAYDGGGRLIDGTKAMFNAVGGLFTLPGRGDMFFDIADEQQKLKIEKDEKYRQGVSKVLADFGKDFYGGLEQRGLLEEYLKRNPDKRATYNRYVTGRRYFREISALFRNSSAKTFYAELAKNPWLSAQYYARHPEKAAQFSSGSEYFNSMKRWVRLLDAGDYENAQAYFDSLPSWIKERYYAKHPDKRGRAQASGAYAAAMGKWVKLLKADDYEAAEKYFRSLPEEYRERYFQKHPEQRAKLGDQRLITQARAYFAADDAGKAAMLDRSPEFAKWLRQQGGNEELRRGMIMAAYRSIPKDETWLRRVYREKYPEIFSQDAAGVRRLRGVARDLSENPLLVEGYERWVEYQYRVYNEQLKLSKTPPKPLEVERLKDWRHRVTKRRRKAARFSPRHSPVTHPG